MATTYARVGSRPYRIVGNQRQTTTNVTLDTTYVTGGMTLTAAGLGLTKVDSGWVADVTATGGAQNIANASFDPATLKVSLYDETPAESGTTIGATVVKVIAQGY